MNRLLIALIAGARSTTALAQAPAPAADTYAKQEMMKEEEVTKQTSKGAGVWAAEGSAKAANVPAAAAMMTTALTVGAFAGTSPGGLQFGMIVMGGLVMTGSVGPIAAVVIDVSHPDLRATATSILALMQNLLALAGGPLLTGGLADVYGLQFAMSVVPALSLLAAGMFIIAARTYLTDTQSNEHGPRRSRFELQAT